MTKYLAMAMFFGLTFIDIGSQRSRHPNDISVFWAIMKAFFWTAIMVSLLVNF